MPDEQVEEWRKHLSAEQRLHFERVGEDLVRRDLYVYNNPEKKAAALAWLVEKRRARERRESVRFHLLLWSTIAAAAGGVAAAVFTAVPYLK